MVQIDILYEGELRTNARHAPSGTMLYTDAPKDNEGRGESFSPTDLVATALGSCMLTIMGIFARRKGIELAGAKLSVRKHMVQNPRRIGKLEVFCEMPAGIPVEHREALRRAALTCPVHESIHPAIEVSVDLRYPD